MKDGGGAAYSGWSGMSLVVKVEYEPLVERRLAGTRSGPDEPLAPSRPTHEQVQEP